MYVATNEYAHPHELASEITQYIIMAVGYFLSFFLSFFPLSELLDFLMPGCCGVCMCGT